MRVLSRFEEGNEIQNKRISAKALSAIVVVAIVFIALLVSRFTGSSGASNAAAVQTTATAPVSTTTTVTVSKTKLSQMVAQAKQAYEKVYASYQGTPSGADQSQFLQLEGQEARNMTQLGMSLPETSTISSTSERALVVDTNSVIAAAQTCMSDMAGVLDGSVTDTQLKNDIQFYQQQYDIAVKALS